MKHVKRSMLLGMLGIVLTTLLTATVAQAAGLSGAMWRVVASPAPGSASNLLGVAAVSASDVWAVGDYLNTSSGFYQTLIEQWNGSSWKVVSSPSVASNDDALNGIAVVSATDIWAVGDNGQGHTSPGQALIEHWNGTRWKIVPGPIITGSTGNQLLGVAAVSASNIWAVGFNSNSTGPGQTLIEHWNGSSWKVVSSPNPGLLVNELLGVAAVSANNIWAVGDSQNGNGTIQTLIEHWNGSSWKVVSSPNPGSNFNSLQAVAAVSASNLWAVGYTQSGNNPTQTLTEHWNGTSWQVVSSPNITGANSNVLQSVAALSASNIWAVGVGENGGSLLTLTEHWNGTSWKIIASPDAGLGDNNLLGVTAVSSSNIWAVGYYINNPFASGPVLTLTELYS